MKRSFVICAALVAAGLAHAQAPDSADNWGSAPAASDDRFSNPKSKLYSGPNGYYNTGEVRAEVANAAKTRYAFKTSFNYIGMLEAFAFADNGKLMLVTVQFGAEQPGVGTYDVAAKPDVAKKKVKVNFADVSDKKLREWVGTDKAGIVTVSLVNGFLYVKARGLRLTPTGLHNTGDMKQPLLLGFEGAVKPG